MAGKYTEAQKRASLKYQEDKVQLKITVSKKKADTYRDHAKEKGTDLTKLIVALLEKDIEETKQSVSKEYNNTGQLAHLYHYLTTDNNR